MQNKNKKAIIYIALSVLLVQHLFGAIQNSYAEVSLVEEVPNIVESIISDEARILRISDEATLVKKDTSSDTVTEIASGKDVVQEETVIVEVIEEKIASELEEEKISPTTQVVQEEQKEEENLELPTPNHLQNMIISKKAWFIARSSSNRDLLRIFVRNRNKFKDINGRAYDARDFTTAWKILSHNYGQKNAEVLQIEKQRFIEIYLTLK